jgi:ssDNA-binding replication factor A large subunit
MYNFESLVDEIVRQRPDIPKEKLLQMVSEKKSTIGAGYLTDQGALFIIANELGVNLERIRQSELGLKELQIGLRNVSIKARVLGIYPIRTYTRHDGSHGRYMRLVLFEDGTIMRAVVWDKSLETILQRGLQVGHTIRLTNCNIRQGFDGRPEINVSGEGKVEILQTGSVMDICSEQGQNLKEGTQLVCVKCTVLTEPKVSSFTRDERQHSVMQFRAKVDNGDECRIVIWDPVSIPEITKGVHLRLINVKVKKSSDDKLEIHGDEATTLAIIRPEPLVVRILRVVKSRNKFALALDETGKVIPILLSSKTETLVSDGQILSITPEKQTPRYVVCTSENSLVPITRSFPRVHELRLKLTDALKRDSRSMLEVISLSHPVERKVKTKDGSMVSLTELLVGDDTGETKVTGWRDSAWMISNINPGERILLIGTYPVSTKFGDRILQVDRYCVVEKVSY